MVDNIRMEFVDVLRQTEWMDENTRNEAIKKANALTAYIGYPNELTDDNKLEEYFEGLEFEADNMLVNRLRLNVFLTDLAFNKLREPINKVKFQNFI